MTNVFVTRRIPQAGIDALRAKGYEVTVSELDRPLTKPELIEALSAAPYDAVLCLLTDHVDAEVLDAAPQAKIFANYAVGFDNIDLAETARRNVLVANTPDVLTETVAEHTAALLFAIACRISEGERYLRSGKPCVWGPMMLLGTDLKGKTLGLVGAGRIGSRVAEIASKGMGMNVVYHDLKQNEAFEASTGATYLASLDELLPQSDAVSLHVPLLESTRHLMNASRLAQMKSTAYLVNTSRGPVIDEVALVQALTAGTIRGAALDVFEHEPEVTPELLTLENVIVTPHIASASEETRDQMALLAAEAIIDTVEGRTPQHLVKAS